jgi:uncharacterized protein
MKGALMQRCAFLLILTVVCAAADAQTLDLTAGDIPDEFQKVTTAADHTRLDLMIPMRDGVKLNTIVVLPKQAAEPMPMVLLRTPYNAEDYATRDGSASPRMAMNVPADDEALVREGYVLVYQDIRGRHKSEGVYIVNRPPRGPLNASGIDHATDTWDTIDWLVKNVPGNNGRVGITGISYDGFLTLMALFEPHPALKAAVPANAMVDSWRGDDWYHNGAFRQTMIGWIYAVTSTKEDDLPVPYGYRDLFAAFLDAGSAAEVGRRYNADRLPAWRRIIDNPAYDRLWQEQAVHRLLERVAVAVPTMTVHSLFDQEDIFGPIASYAALEKHDTRNDRNFLVIGPWFHGQQAERDASALGAIRWDSNTARFFREHIRQPFWDLHLKGKSPTKPLAPVIAFETGTNEWRTYEAWPPQGATARKVFLQAGGRLGFEAPSAKAERYTEYVSDPAKPIPYQPRPIVDDYAQWEPWLTTDQRAVTDRPDVVSFVTEPLTAPLTLRGRPLAHLTASTSGTDADWVVKLIDVYPPEYPAQPELGGFQLMISADILRGRYRESFETARPIPAGKPLEYRIALPHINHTFRPGHRVMVQIQSSWFPLYDRNPQRFVPNIAYAKPEDFTRATHRIHHASGAASFVELPVAAD